MIFNSTAWMHRPASRLFPTSWPSRSATATHEVVAFAVGRSEFVVAREQVARIRRSSRVRRSTVATPETAPPVLSISTLFHWDRDRGEDLRVLEVEHEGSLLALEVTSIEGIRLLSQADLLPLPDLIARTCSSPAVIGLAQLGDICAVAVDLASLLQAAGVENPGAAST